jgi:hypothetical protein
MAILISLAISYGFAIRLNIVDNTLGISLNSKMIV